MGHPVFLAYLFSSSSFLTQVDKIFHDRAAELGVDDPVGEDETPERQGKEDTTPLVNGRGRNPDTAKLDLVQPLRYFVVPILYR